MKQVGTAVCRGSPKCTAFVFVHFGAEVPSAATLKTAVIGKHIGL